MNIFHHQFSTGQVVAATGVTNAALQSWLRRNLIVGHKTTAPIEGGGTPGAHRKFSFFNVMEIAIAKALTDTGLKDIDAAMKAAMHFAHSGHAAVGDNPGRMPSLPFDWRQPPRKTILCVAGERSTVTYWRPGNNDFWVIARHQLGNPEGFVALEINPVFERVVANLGYDYRDVLEIAYPHNEQAE